MDRSEIEAKVKGATVDVFISGGDGDVSVTVYCEHNAETQWLCPFCLSDVMPPEEGARCFRKNGCDCMDTAAKIDALKRARAAASKAIGELEAGGAE